MAAYAKPGTAIYRDLSLAEYPYSLHSLGPHALVAAPLWGQNAWPLRVTGDPETDAHTQRCDRLHRAAAGGALLGQTLDLLLNGSAAAERCSVVSSRYASTGELEYLLQPLGDVVDVFGTGRHLRAHIDAPSRRPLGPKIWARLSSAVQGPPTATAVGTAGATSSSLLGPCKRTMQSQRPDGTNHALLRHISEHAALSYFGDNDCIFRDKRS